jgi:hypothetical protein
MLAEGKLLDTHIWCLVVTVPSGKEQTGQATAGSKFPQSFCQKKAQSTICNAAVSSNEANERL